MKPLEPASPPADGNGADWMFIRMSIGQLLGTPPETRAWLGGAR